MTKRIARITLIIDIDVAAMDDEEIGLFVMTPEGAHYALDHGQLVHSGVERIVGDDSA